jgi:hypothetical protein
MTDNWQDVVTGAVPSIVAIIVAAVSVFLTAWLSFRYQLKAAGRVSRHDSRKAAYINALESLKRVQMATGLAIYHRGVMDRVEKINGDLATVVSRLEKATKNSANEDSDEVRQIEELRKSITAESHQLNWEMVAQLNTSSGIAGFEFKSYEVGWEKFGDTPNSDLIAALNDLWLKLGTSGEAQFAEAQVVMMIEKVPDPVLREFADVLASLKTVMSNALNRSRPFGVTDSTVTNLWLPRLGKTVSKDLDGLLTN